VAVARIGVAGAGTMGAGIAQVAALGGFDASLHDPDAEALAAAPERISVALERGARRGLWRETDAGEAIARISPAPALADLGGCDLVIEAAPERLELKRELFTALAEICGPDTILASNTSSIPVTRIAEGVPGPERVCGMHFFNPPALMRLVEIVRGERTAEAVVEAATETARAMGREPVLAKDSVGFIANRCNRPFSLESLRMLADGVAEAPVIDAVIREDGGYRMGPFELMDLVGIDVGLSVARSFFEQRPLERWRPSPIQEQMVNDGRFGRKSGRGFYEYEDGGLVDPGPGTASLDPEQRAEILERVVCQLVNEAHFARDEEVATEADIDTAMRLGLNHPLGPFEWERKLSRGRVTSVLSRLRDATGDERYEISPSLMPP
jgi:3-hydroxybutyryl-CoA dehydrogenase